jgi:hypothetical protein
MGFFEGLIGLAGGRDVRAEFIESSWRGDRQTIIGFSWEQPSSVQAVPRARTRASNAHPPEL